MIKPSRLLKSFIYSYRGFKKAIKEEQNLKIQLVFAFIVAITGLLVGISRYEWLILVIVIGIVILTEVINSAVERVADLLKPRMHDFVKEIKDIMAAAVVVSALISILAGTIIFYPYFLDILQNL